MPSHLGVDSRRHRHLPEPSTTKNCWPSRATPLTPPPSPQKMTRNVSFFTTCKLMKKRCLDIDRLPFLDASTDISPPLSSSRPATPQERATLRTDNSQPTDKIESTSIQSPRATTLLRQWWCPISIYRCELVVSLLFHQDRRQAR